MRSNKTYRLNSIGFYKKNRGDQFMNKNVKKYIIFVLLWSGICYNISEVWEFLEMYFDGGVQHSIADTFIAAILTFVIWNNVIKFIEIK